MYHNGMIQRRMLIAWTMLLLCVVFSGLSCGEGKDRPPPVSEVGDLPDQEAWGHRSILSDLGVTKAVVEAGHVRKYGKKGITEMDEGVRIQFFDRDGTVSSVLTSDTVVLEDKTKDIEAGGNVVVTSKDSVRLETDLLRWDHRKERIFADGWVRISSKEGVETGVGFESDPDLRRWSMREVKGTWRGSPDSLER